MSRTKSASRWIAVLLTSASIACSGKACGSAAPTGSTNAGLPVASLSVDQKRQA